MNPQTGTIAVTDGDWYRFLRARPDLDEVNFWKPSARTFNAEPGSPFFFKLKKREGDQICGFGFFAGYTRTSMWLAWEFFGEKNGCPTLEAMQRRMNAIRKRNRIDRAAQIGNILVVEPAFFDPAAWVRSPRDWSPNIVSDKRYDLTKGEGLRVWRECLERAPRYREGELWVPDVPTLETPTQPVLFGTPQLRAPRLGQGSFRALVSDAYGWGCSISGEHSAPALDAAHIRPVKEQGPHSVDNGLLLRADLHRLFDRGYLTVTPEHVIEVSSRLRDEFQNGHSYYPFNGQRVRLPDTRDHWPARDHLRWHNENVYVG